MPKITSGNSATVSIPAGSVISLASSGGLLRYEYPTGTVLYEGEGVNQFFGPYGSTANATITSLFGGIDYAITALPLLGIVENASLTGDVTSVGNATTLASSGVTAALYGSASGVAQVTLDAKGRATLAATVPIAIANTAVSGLGTMSTQNAAAVAVTGGTVNGTSVGATTAASGRFTTLQVAEGANAKQGTAVLAAGAVTVANTSITASSRIFVTSNIDGGTPGFLRVSARVAGTSFTITSSSGTDTSTVAYEIFEPA